MISIGQYNNSSYLKYCLHVNIFVTHDELYFTKHVHSQKKTLSHTHSHTNKQIKQQQQPQEVIYGASYKQ